MYFNAIRENKISQKFPIYSTFVVVTDREDKHLHEKHQATGDIMPEFACIEN